MDYTPLYIKVKNYIIDKILSGEFIIDEKLPTGKELCDIFEVSRITVDMAMKELTKEGYVYRLQGKGTYVKGKANEKNLNDFLQIAFENQMNQMVELQNHSTLGISKISPTIEIAQKLGINRDEKVNEIVRMRMDNDIVMAIEYIYIPVSVVGELKMDNDPGNSFIHSYLEEKFNIKMKQIKIYIQSENANELESEKFNIPMDTRLLLLENIMIDLDNNIGAYSRHIINDTFFNFFISINLET
jgi:GntR family transcriptional regulator